MKKTYKIDYCHMCRQITNHLKNVCQKCKGVCPNIKKHTKVPKDYISWCKFAEKKSGAGYRQKRCPNCDLFAIWVKPKTKK